MGASSGNSGIRPLHFDLVANAWSLFLGNPSSSLQDGDGLGFINQQMGSESNGFVTSGMVIYQKMTVGSFSGYFIEFPKPLAVLHPTVAM